ncbi:hypothetical protein BHM03_00039677 [Ensete ventricosum]|nr:hypothetical protein BHM03_00039677 [Ensete ventricosum]
MFRSIFHAPSWNFKILVIPNVLAHGKSYEHDFTKKFKFRSVFRAPSWNFKILAIPNILARGRLVEFRSIFYAPSQISKYWLAIPNIFAHGKSYDHSFMKKHDSDKHCAKSRAASSFYQFFVHCLRISKY